MTGGRTLLRAILAAGSAAALLLTLAPPASPALTDSVPLHVFGGRSGANGFTYYNPVVAVPVGGSLTLVSLDIIEHDVVSVAKGSDSAPWCITWEPGTCPLFWSEKVSSLPGSGGPLTPVLGLENMVALESYAFYCTLHSEMKGTLVALPAVDA